MRYEVGDRVKIRGDLKYGAKYGDYTFDDICGFEIGKTVTIENTFNQWKDCYGYKGRGWINSYLTDEMIERKVMTKEEFTENSIPYFKSIGGNGQSVNRNRCCWGIDCKDCMFNSKLITIEQCMIINDFDKAEQLLTDWMKENDMENMELKTNRVYRLKNGRNAIALYIEPDRLALCTWVASGWFFRSECQTENVIAYTELTNQAVAECRARTRDITSWDWEATSPEKQRVMDRLKNRKSQLVVRIARTKEAISDESCTRTHVVRLEQELEDM